MTINKRWTIKEPNEAIVFSLQQALGINTNLCRLLVNRGIVTYEDAKDFFRPSLEKLHDPFLMKGMHVAVKRIDEAIAREEKIMFLGDYDVDGTTSVAVVYSFFYEYLSATRKEHHINYYIPHRYHEGYGVSIKAIETAQKLGVSLLITLDCGTKANTQISYAKSLGIDVIVCDHHNPGDDLPEAIAILNPKQSDCNYPFKELSACGIGFKLIAALCTYWSIDQYYAQKHLDLVATSIAADIVPIKDENRILAFHGLIKANTNPCIAIQTLKQLVGLDRSITISDLVFMIAPRINAAGRMDDATKAVAFFIENDIEKSKFLADNLQIDNSDRKEIDKNITDEAIGLLENIKQNQKFSTVLYRPYWHKGVVGIVASRLIDHYYRPTIILTDSQEGKISGSARSIIGFNIHDAINACSHLLDSFGGHFFAAGLTLPASNLNAFIDAFENEVASTINPEYLTPIIYIDVIISLAEISENFFKILKQFEPYGPENMRPVFLAKNVKNFRSKIVKEQHVKFSVYQDGSKIFDGIGFNLAQKFDLLHKTEGFDIVFTIEENSWQGNNRLQLKVIDIK